MRKLKIGIIKEGKMPPDSRVPLIPRHCKFLQDKYPGMEIFVQSSPHRCFSDQEYRDLKINVVDSVEHCDILFGVKEVPVDDLLPDKTYLFFSHTIKEQAANRKLLQSVIQQNIKLIDYERLTNENGIRVIAFGNWAGIVGAYNGCYAWGKRTGSLSLKRAYEFKDYKALQSACEGLQIPPLKIIITGDGRVAVGAVEMMELLKIRRLDPNEYLEQENDDAAVYIQLSPAHLYQHKEGKDFTLKDFFAHPQDYRCDFKKYYSSTDLMINAIYWDPRAPRFFSKEEMQSPDFKIKVIADISCDINGSVPATLRATTIQDPVYGYDPLTGRETAPYQAGTVDIMSIDNLPNELPRDASASFGDQLLEHVIEELMDKNSPMIQRATIADKGVLGRDYQYLSNYVKG